MGGRGGGVGSRISVVQEPLRVSETFIEALNGQHYLLQGHESIYLFLLSSSSECVQWSFSEFFMWYSNKSNAEANLRILAIKLDIN